MVHFSFDLDLWGLARLVKYMNSWTTYTNNLLIAVNDEIESATLYSYAVNRRIDQWATDSHEQQSGFFLLQDPTKPIYPTFIPIAGYIYIYMYVYM